MKRLFFFYILMIATAFCSTAIQLSVPASAEYSVDKERAVEFANEYATHKFGRCALGEAWEYSDPLGTRVAYMIPVRIGMDEFVEPRNIEDWENGYGRIVVSARSYLSPILECCPAPPWEIVNDDLYRKIIHNETGEDGLYLSRIFYMPLGIKLFRYSGDVGTHFIDPMSLEVISEGEFIEFIDELRIPENNVTPESAPSEFVDRWEEFDDIFSMVDVMIDGYETVPYFDWEYGCCPTSGAMLFGYWENYTEVGKIITGYFSHVDHKYAEINYHVPDLKRYIAGYMTTDTTYNPPYDYSYGGTHLEGIANGLFRTVENKELPFNITQVMDASYFNLTSKINDGFPVIWNNCWNRPSGTACHCMTAVGYGDGELLYLHNTWDNVLDERWTWTYCSITGTDSYTGEFYTYGTIFSQGVTAASLAGSLDGRNLRLTSPCPGSGLNTEAYGPDPGDVPEYSPGNELVVSWTGASPTLPLIVQLSIDDGKGFDEIGFVPSPDVTDSFIWTIPGSLATSIARVRILQFEDGEIVSGDGSYSPFFIGEIDSCLLPDDYERGDSREAANWIYRFPFEANCNFDNEDDVDWFGFLATPLESYSISAGNPASPVVSIMNNDGGTMAVYDGLGDSVSFEFIPDSTDVYYMAISKSDMSEASGCYHLRMTKTELVDTSCMVPDDYEPDDVLSSATPIVLSGEMQFQRHTAYPENDTDYYEVHLEEGDTLWIITRTFQNIKLQVDLYNPTGSLRAIGPAGTGPGYNCMIGYSGEEYGDFSFKVYCSLEPPEGTSKCYDIFYGTNYIYEYLAKIVPAVDTAVVGEYYQFKPNLLYAYSFDYCDYPSWMSVSDSIISGVPPVGDTTYSFTAMIELYGFGTDSAKVDLYVRDCPQLEEVVYDSVFWGENYIRHLDAGEGFPVVYSMPGWITFDGDSIFGITPDSLSYDLVEWIAYEPYCSDTQTLAIFGVTGIGENSAPRRFSLKPVFPNPTNSSALVSFTVPSSGIAELKIIDITGRQVIHKTINIEKPGIIAETLQLNGLSSGHYLVKLSFCGEDRFSKFVLLK